MLRPIIGPMDLKKLGENSMSDNEHPVLIKKLEGGVSLGWCFALQRYVYIWHWVGEKHYDNNPYEYDLPSYCMWIEQI